MLGDPQFVGFRGNLYQVHGLNGTVYNVLSDVEVQLNVRFVFLSTGVCPPVSVITKCWTHPGSYFGEFAVQTRTGIRLLVLPGAAAEGIALVTFDERNVPLSTAAANYTSADGSITLSVRSRWQLRVRCGNYHLQLINSDQFINLESIRVDNWTRLASILQPHGLLGQSCRYTPTSPGLDIAAVEGRVDDYAETENDTFGSSFLYNKFIPKARVWP